MKQILLLPVIFLFCWACEKEDALTPTPIESNRIEDSLDFSYPLVKEYYEKYGVAIMNRFDENEDLKFNFYSYNPIRSWYGIEISKISRKTELDSVMEILENDILSCFKDEFEWNGTVYRSDFRKKYFPNKILVVNGLISTFDFYNDIASESVNRVSSDLMGALHCLVNDNAMIMNLDLKTMLSSEENFQRFRKDILYVLITSAITKHKLYEQVPAGFYDFCAGMYGRPLEDVMEENGEEPLEYISRVGYIDYGILCNSVFPIEGQNGFATALNLPGKERDFRVFVDQLISPQGVALGSIEPHAYKTTLVTTQKMWYVAHALLNWGIDVKLLNDDPEFLNLIQLDEETIKSFE